MANALVHALALLLLEDQDTPGLPLFAIKETGKDFLKFLTGSQGLLEDLWVKCQMLGQTMTSICWIWRQ